MANNENGIVALYVRVSTGYQIDKDSLPHQKKELKGYCEHVLHIDKSRIEIFEDAGKSAKNTKRPAFERMMKKVRSGQISHVMVYKIDRISRNLVDFSLMYEDFKRERVTFISLNEQFDTSTAMGECMLKIILVFAELERKMTSERVTDIMLGRARNKQWNGANVPFGYSWDSESEMPMPDDKESPILQMMFNFYEKHESSCQLRDYLNSHDIPTKRGGEWTSKTVADIIRNPIYKGTYRYNYRESAHGRVKPESEWIVIDDVFVPLVTKEQWQHCNEIMDANAQSKGNVGRVVRGNHPHVFGGLLRCGVCGSNMLSDKDTMRANGFWPSNYRCGNQYRKNTCRPKFASDVKLGPFVFNYIRNIIQATNNPGKFQTAADLEMLLLSGPEFKDIKGIAADGLDAMYESIKHPGKSVSYKPKTDDSQSDNESERAASLTAERDKNIKALERLKRLYLFSDDGMPEKEYLQTRQQLEIRNAQIDNELKEMELAEHANDESVAWMANASAFLLANKLSNSEHIVYKVFAPLVSDEMLKDFVQSVIERIIILDGHVDSIIFKNGITHQFIWNK